MKLPKAGDDFGSRRSVESLLPKVIRSLGNIYLCGGAVAGKADIGYNCRSEVLRKFMDGRVK
ncbi:MAG: hypothetical protein PHS82_07335 [Lachnospiraceae bacterium]|nr:hypothetical protein [Lachnospiraceae bacterium]